MFLWTNYYCYVSLIEFDIKNEIYKHYQKLDRAFLQEEQHW